ncbi:MAG TPA: arginine--tRNA ligase [Chitinophagales bacterium]
MSISIQKTLQTQIVQACQALFGTAVNPDSIVINFTNPEFEGDYTIVVFPLVKIAKLSPEKTGEALGEYLQKNTDFVEKFNVVKGFLNLSFTSAFWIKELSELAGQKERVTFPPKHEKVLLEYAGPNTNKPLHIGHLRNVMIGFSMGEILKTCGYDLTKVNIYNDRGISISKSMAAYLHSGNGTTPQGTGIKGDHFVGDYYVLFGRIVEQELRAKYAIDVEVENVFKAIGKDREVAEQETEIFALAKDLLLKWEAGEEKTIVLWKQMNAWVYAGFNETFDLLGIDFQKDYYESETYKLGKNIIDEGLQKNVFYKRADGAVAIDLTPEGLDEKVLLRSDGTSIYITQDLGTAELRHEEFGMDKMIYVVANEQDYHFKVLKLALKKLGKKWADGIFHLSYALVESPTGRFKSREGKTADADDMISEVLRIAKERTQELGKIEDFTEAEANTLYHTIGLGALKYFILRVNPYQKIIFNPEASIDFHGQTGPFIQYTHARIKSVIRKAENGQNALAETVSLHAIERQIIQQLSEYKNIIESACEKYDPSEIANYVYSLAKLYSKFYGELKIISADKEDEKQLRLALSSVTANTIKHAMRLLGIEVPEKM